MQTVMSDLDRRSRRQTAWLIILTCAMIVTIIFTTVTLSILERHRREENGRQDSTEKFTTASTIISTNLFTAVTTAATTITTTNLIDLSERIYSSDLMFHLKQLQFIADRHQQTRALGTSGFDATVDYIENVLKSKTNLLVFRQRFNVPTSVQTEKILTSTINGTEKKYNHRDDFVVNIISGLADFNTSVRLTLIRNYGCDEDDWINATPHRVMDSVALVMLHETCSMVIQSSFAQKYNTSGLLVYDPDSNSTRLPIVVPVRNITYPLIVIRSKIAMELISSLTNYPTINSSIRIVVPQTDTVTVQIPTLNLCADTSMGQKNQTIVIGGHSDSVTKGPGINDNGSGAMGILVLALKLAELYEKAPHFKHEQRIRFCWWGGEEYGMRGSYHHVEVANETNTIGDRLQDYLLLLNFDMLASPNYQFGILDSNTLPDFVTDRVKRASLKISKLFRFWFDRQNLPWDNSSLGIQSDHVPFLIAGIPSGGTESGADTRKTLEQRNRYDQMIGHGSGGIADVSYDPCYHEACDTIENINPLAYAIMVKAAAFVVQTLASMSDLRAWLYTD